MMWVLEEVLTCPCPSPFDGSGLYGQSIAFILMHKTYVPIALEAGTMAGYFAWYFSLAFSFPSLLQTAAFILISHMAFGILHLQVSPPPPC